MASSHKRSIECCGLGRITFRLRGRDQRAKRAGRRYFSSRSLSGYLPLKQFECLAFRIRSVVLCAIRSTFLARPKNDRRDYRTYTHGVLALLGAESLSQWLPYRHGFRPVRLACLNGASDTIFGGHTHPAFWISPATRPSSKGRWRQLKQCPIKVARSRLPQRRRRRFAIVFCCDRSAVPRLRP